jgi:hypothetical protein
MKSVSWTDEHASPRPRILLASIATARATVDVYYVCRPGLTEIITDEGGIRGSTGFWRGKNGMAQKRLPTRLFREKGNTLYYSAGVA